jgi:glycosyltransferase involved in cell wall biosynthesis
MADLPPWLFQPRISVITPSYNQGAFLEATIRSVLGQGYPDLEYIIVDGASTDNSVEIIRKYEDRLAWWVSEPDHGQAEAINKGFAHATGEIIGWLNSDDIYLPRAFEQAVTGFHKVPAAGIVFGDVLAIDAEGRSINTMRYGDWGLEDLMCFSIIGQPGVFMRHNYLEQAREKGFYLDTHYHYMLDHQLWLRIAMLAPMVHIPELIAAGRFHADAKNIAQAAHFGQEAYSVLAWMKTQPGLAEKFEKLSPRIWAGAHRYNGRYLLDGNQPGPALQSYWKSLRADPSTAIVEWHRMVYAVLCLLGFRRVKRVYMQLRQLIHQRREPELYN